jgi:hypothetical protein
VSGITNITINREVLIEAYQQAERTVLEANAALRKANQMLQAAGTAHAEAEATVAALRAILQGSE